MTLAINTSLEDSRHESVLDLHVPSRERDRLLPRAQGGLRDFLQKLSSHPHGHRKTYNTEGPVSCLTQQSPTGDKIDASVHESPQGSWCWVVAAATSLVWVRCHVHMSFIPIRTLLVSSLLGMRKK